MSNWKKLYRNCNGILKKHFDGQIILLYNMKSKGTFDIQMMMIRAKFILKKSSNLCALCSQTWKTPDIYLDCERVVAKKFFFYMLTWLHINTFRINVIWISWPKQQFESLYLKLIWRYCSVFLVFQQKINMLKGEVYYRKLGINFWGDRLEPCQFFTFRACIWRSL